jgi:hypothetical protein
LMGCSSGVAAVALFHWVAELFWLRSQTISGLHRSLGWRFAQSPWVAEIKWLPVRTESLGCRHLVAAVARMFWVAKEGWLFAGVLWAAHKSRLRFAAVAWVAWLLWLCGSRKRTIPLGCRNQMAAGSHGIVGLQASCGCGRTHVLGCKGGVAVRRNSLGCTQITAAVALFHWVAELFWLRSQTISGLHRSPGWRFAQSPWVAEIKWLPVRTVSLGFRGILATGFAIFQWGSGWLGLPVRTHFLGCKSEMADRTSQMGCNRGLAAVAFFPWMSMFEWLFAYINWVAIGTWLRSHFYFGLTGVSWLEGSHTSSGLQALRGWSHFFFGIQIHAGCRFRTFHLDCRRGLAGGVAHFTWINRSFVAVINARSSGVAGDTWLFATCFWDAAVAWLEGGASILGFNQILATGRTADLGCRHLMAAVALLLWINRSFVAGGVARVRWVAGDVWLVALFPWVAENVGLPVRTCIRGGRGALAAVAHFLWVACFAWLVAFILWVACDERL